MLLQASAAADARDHALPATILWIMLILSKKTFAARTVQQVACRPELCSGEMKKAPVYKTGQHKTNADAGLQNRPTQNKRGRRFTKPANTKQPANIKQTRTPAAQHA
jgi:hypothetical protein